MTVKYETQYDDATLQLVLSSMTFANFVQEGLSTVEDLESRRTLVVAAPNDQIVASFDWDTTSANPHHLAAYFAKATPALLHSTLTELLYRRNHVESLSEAREYFEQAGYAVIELNEFEGDMSPKAKSVPDCAVIINDTTPAALVKRLNLRRHSLELMPNSSTIHWDEPTDIFTREQVEMMFKQFISQLI